MSIPPPTLTPGKNPSWTNKERLDIKDLNRVQTARQADMRVLAKVLFEPQADGKVLFGFNTATTGTGSNLTILAAAGAAIDNDGNILIKDSSGAVNLTSQMVVSKANYVHIYYLESDDTANQENRRFKNAAPPPVENTVLGVVQKVKTYGVYVTQPTANTVAPDRSNFSATAVIGGNTVKLIPICVAQITAGGVVTLTDFRHLLAGMAGPDDQESNIGDAVDDTSGLWTLIRSLAAVLIQHAGNGTDAFDTSSLGTLAEVFDARGGQASLDDRISAEHAADGTHLGITQDFGVTAPGRSLSAFFTALTYGLRITTRADGSIVLTTNALVNAGTGLWFCEDNTAPAYAFYISPYQIGAYKKDATASSWNDTGWDHTQFDFNNLTGTGQGLAKLGGISVLGNSFNGVDVSSVEIKTLRGAATLLIKSIAAAGSIITDTATDTTNTRTNGNLFGCRNNGTTLFRVDYTGRVFASGGADLTGSATLAALRLVPQAQPSSPSDGALYFDSGDNSVQARVNGAWIDLYREREAENHVAIASAWTGDLYYWKDRNGVVHLDGAATASAPAGILHVLATLPAGYRPARNQTFGGTAYDSSSGMETLRPRMLINTAGQIILDNTGSAYSTANEGVSFSGVSFRA